ARPFEENNRIPAGYTYLAQFVIHDSVHSLADPPDIKKLIRPRNGRSGRLVLDTIYGKGPGVGAGGREGDARPIRDLPRSSCPYSGKPAYSDVLIADSRNDDNVIIAQLTVLFHLLHNTVYAELHKKNTATSPTKEYFRSRGRLSL